MLGMIFPPLNRPLPPEATIMYPHGVKFLIEGLGLESLTPEGYDKVIPLIKPAAERLAKAGSQAIILMGTSLTFYKGAAFNQQLTDSIKSATGLPATTMSTAVIEGLKTVGAKRLAVSTAYNDVVNDRLTAFLKENGLEVVKIKGLGITDMETPGRVTRRSVIEVQRRRAQLRAGRQRDAGLLRRPANPRNAGAAGKANSRSGGIQHPARPPRRSPAGWA